MSEGRTAAQRLGVGVYLVALAVLAIGGLRSVATSEQATILPDPDVPPLGETILGDVDGFVVHFSGPSPNRGLTSNDVRLSEARRQALVESSLTAFLRPDVSAGVIVEVMLTRADGAGSAFLGLTEPVNESRLDGFPEPTEVAVLDNRDNWFEAESVTVEGAYALRVRAFSTGPFAETDGRSLLRDVTSEQWGRLDQPDQLPTLDGINLERGRRALLSAEIGAILVGAVYLGAATALADRAARRRIALRLRHRSRHFEPPFTTDVRVEAHKVLRRSRWRGMMTILATITAIVLASALRLGVVQTGLFLIVALLIHGLVLRKLRLSPAPTAATHPRLRGWAFATAIPLVAIGLGILLFGAGAIWTGVAADAIGVVNPDGLSVENYQRISLIVGLFAIAFSVAPIMLARRLGAVRHARLLQDDRRTPTLFLRSFADDGLSMRSRSAGDVSPLDRLTLRRWERFEEIVARAVHTIGPIRALSDPGTKLPRLGAVRERVSDDAWQGRIADLIETSGLVVVSLARTEHCVLEIRDLQQRGALHKTLFIVAPVKPTERRKRLQVLADTLGISPLQLDFESPDTVVLAAVVHPLLGIRVFTSDAPDDISYQLAVAAAQAFIETDWTQTPPAVPVSNHDFVPVEWGSEQRVWAPGRAPRQRVWYRRLPGIAAIMMLLSVAATAMADLLPPIADGTIVPIGVGIQTVIADPESGNIVALAYDGRLFTIDPTTIEVQEAGSLSGPMTSLTSDGPLVAGVHSGDRVLSAVNLTDTASWSVELETAPTELSIMDDGIIVTFGTEGAIRSFDRANGDLIGERSIEGVPWGVAPSSRLDSVLVSLADDHRIVEIDTGNLDTVREFPGPPAPKSISRSPLGWTVETSYRAGITVFDPATGWEQLIEANQVYPAKSSGDWAQPSLDTGNGQNYQLTTYLPGRSEACVLEFATYSHSHVVTPEGIIAVVFTDRAGLELYDVNDCG